MPYAKWSWLVSHQGSSKCKSTHLNLCQASPAFQLHSQLGGSNWDRDRAKVRLQTKKKKQEKTQCNMKQRRAGNLKLGGSYSQHATYRQGRRPMVRRKPQATAGHRGCCLLVCEWPGSVCGRAVIEGVWWGVSLAGCHYNGCGCNMKLLICGAWQLCFLVIVLPAGLFVCAR